MSQFIRYPTQSGGGASGSQTGVAYVVGPLDGAPTNANGGMIGSLTFYQQSATATFPGLVSSANQTFSGVKTFSSGPILNSLSASAPVKTDSSKSLVSGSISLTADVTGILPQGNLPTTHSIGSVTVTSSAGGAAYTLRLPGTTGIASSFLQNDGSGNFSWGTVGSGGAQTNGKLPIWSQNAAGLSTLAGANNISVGLTSNNISGVATLSCNFITTAAGTVSAPAIQINGTDTLGLYRISLNKMGVTCSGIQSLTVSDLGTSVVSGSFSAAYLTLSAPLLTDGSKALVSGSISLTSHVTGSLPLSQTTGSISLTNQVSGSLPLSQTSGSLPLSQTTGSISLTNQVSGNLPLTQVSGILAQANLPTTLNIGSITFSQTAGGATYNAVWPSAQGGANTVPKNDGSGNLTWVTAVTNPTTSLTIGSVTVTSSTGGNIYSVALPGIQGSSSCSVLTNNGAGALSWKNSFPTIQTFSSGTGTYTPPAGCVWYKFRITGSGGGGGASASQAGDAGNAANGASTTLGSNSATGGLAGGSNGGGGGSGSAGTLAAGSIGFAISGGKGGGGANAAGVASYVTGGMGGANPFGGAGGGGQQTTGGTSGTISTGGGGGGAGGPSGGVSGGGGGAGGYVDGITTIPAAIPYSIADGGLGGTAGTSGAGGGKGGTAFIVIEEHYM